MTDLDWSPELWIACHDEDEQNARLAGHLWEDNGLDVPEKYLSMLKGYLGMLVPTYIVVELTPGVEHDNAYVRSSTASALADSVEHWPQSVTSTLTELQDYYRDKAKVLAPEFDQYVRFSWN